MNGIRLISLVFFGTLLFSLQLVAQNEQTICSRLIPVNIINQDNNRVGSFGSQDVNVLVNGKTVQVEVKRATEAQPILIVLQTSPSMKSNAQAEVAVLKDILGKLPQGVPIGIMVFSDEPKVIAAFSQDRKAAVDAFESSAASADQWKKAANMEKAIEAAVDTLSTQGSGGNIILVGNGVSRTAPPSSMAKRLISARIRLYGHFFDFHQPRTPEETASYENFTDLSEKSGGAQFWEEPADTHPDTRLLLEHDSAIVGQALFPYQFRFNEDPTPKWISVKIMLKPSPIPGTDKLKLNYPRRLPPCTN